MSHEEKIGQDWHSEHALYPKSHENCPDWSSETASRAPKWPMTAPGTHAPAYSAPEMAPSDLPEGSRGLQEAPLDPPEAAKGTPLGRPGRPKRRPRGPKMGPRWPKRGFKMAQVGCKMGPEMRKVAKVKLLKNHWSKMTPRGSQMAHLDPRGREKGPKRTSRRPR